MLECVIGFWHMFACYFVSGIGGNLFSAILGWDYRAVGASTSEMGVQPAFLALMILNWGAFDVSENMKMYRCIIIVVIVIFCAIPFM